jgi:hypothetical protein
MPESFEERVSAVLRDLLSVPAQGAVQVPRGPGFYAWWCRRDHLADTVSPIPFEERPPTASEWSLIYVGISPSRENSTRDVAARITRNHIGGDVGSSTFRLTLAALLVKRLELQPRSGSDRPRLISEQSLSRWIQQAASLMPLLSGHGT